MVRGTVVAMEGEEMTYEKYSTCLLPYESQPGIQGKED